MAYLRNCRKIGDLFISCTVEADANKSAESMGLEQILQKLLMKLSGKRR